MAPRRRFESMDPTVRERLLDTAAREFAAHGYEGASYNRILADAGVSKGAAYYCFDDKRDLYVTVIRQAMAEGRAAVGLPGPMPDVDAYWRELRGVYARSLRYLHERPTMAALARGLAKAPLSLVEDELGAELNAARSWFTDVLAYGQTIGAVRDDVPAELLGVVVDGAGEALDRWTLAHWDELVAAPAGLDGVIDRGMDFIRRLVAPHSSPSK